MKEKWGTIAAFSIEGKDDFSMEGYELVCRIQWLKQWRREFENKAKNKRTHKLNFLSGKVCTDTTGKNWGHCKFLFFPVTRVPRAFSSRSYRFGSLIYSHVHRWWSQAVSVDENFQKKAVALKWNEEMGRDLGRELDTNCTWEEFGEGDWRRGSSCCRSCFPGWVSPSCRISTLRLSCLNIFENYSPTHVESSTSCRC